MIDRDELKELAADDGGGWSGKKWVLLADARRDGKNLGEAAALLECSVSTVTRRWRQLRELCQRRGLDDPGEWDALRRASLLPEGFDVAVFRSKEPKT